MNPLSALRGPTVLWTVEPIWFLFIIRYADNPVPENGHVKATDMATAYEGLLNIIDEDKRSKITELRGIAESDMADLTP